MNEKIDRLMMRIVHAQVHLEIAKEQSSASSEDYWRRTKEKLWREVLLEWNHEFYLEIAEGDNSMELDDIPF